MLTDFVNVRQTSHSKLLLIQGEPAVNKVMGTLLQGPAAPNVAILVTACGELVTEILRQAGYDAHLLETGDLESLSAVLAKQPDLLLLDSEAFEVLLQDVRSRTDEHARMVQANATRVAELERQIDRDEERITELEKRNTELETAVVRAQETIQNMNEIARRTLGSTATKSPGAAGARDNLQREGDSQ